jgi:hypothetical protein
VGADIERDGTGTVFFQEILQTPGNLIDGHGAVNGLECAVTTAPNGCKQALPGVVVAWQLAALGAGIAMVDRVIPDTGHFHRPVPVKLHMDGALRVAESANRRANFGHDPLQ